MNNNFEIPNEFRESIFPEYVHRVTARAIISAQYVERVFNGICIILKPKGLRYSINDFMSGDSSKTKQTLGRMKKELRKTKLFEPSFSDRLSKYVQRRNRIVHGLFADTFKSKSEIHVDSAKAHKYVAECEWVAKEGSQLVEVGFGIYRELGEFFKSYDSNESQINDLLGSFDEFHELGRECIARDHRSHFASNNPQ
jgi:hypothetical protein